jgi:hypothetical protein
MDNHIIRRQQQSWISSTSRVSYSRFGHFQQLCRLENLFRVLPSTTRLVARFHRSRGTL